MLKLVFLTGSNPTRIAKLHILSAGCKAISKDAVLDQEVADALVKGKATAEAIDVDDDAAIQQFQQFVAALPHCCRAALLSRSIASAVALPLTNASLHH